MVAYERPLPYAVCYIRADLHEAARAEARREALEQAAWEATVTAETLGATAHDVLKTVRALIDRED